MEQFKISRPINPDEGTLQKLLANLLPQLCGKPVYAIKDENDRITGYAIKQPTNKEPKSMTNYTCKPAGDRKDNQQNRYSKEAMLLNKIYHDLYLMVSDKVIEIANKLAQKLVSDPHVEVKDIDNQRNIEVSAWINLREVIPEGKPFIEELRHIAKMRGKIAKGMNFEQDIEFLELVPTDKSDMRQGVDLHIVYDGEDFTTLNNAVVSIDNFIKERCDQNGMEYEKICGNLYKSTIRFMEDKDGVCTADCSMIYATNKASYPLEETAEKRIDDAINLK